MSETSIHGKIEGERIRCTRPIRSFVEKHLMHWVQGNLHRIPVPRKARQALATESEGSGVNEDEGATYSVSFSRDGDGSIVNCSVEIRFGHQVWRGRNLAHGLNDAFLRSLRNMSSAVVARSGTA